MFTFRNVGTNVIEKFVEVSVEPFILGRRHLRQVRQMASRCEAALTAS